MRLHFDPLQGLGHLAGCPASAGSHGWVKSEHNPSGHHGTQRIADLACTPHIQSSEGPNELHTCSCGTHTAAPVIRTRFGARAIVFVNA